MFLIVTSCLQTRVEGRMQWLHLADDAAVKWPMQCGLWMQMITTASGVWLRGALFTCWLFSFWVR